MPKIMPITDLRNTTDVSAICHADDEPVFITKNGYGDLVIMSMDAYDRLIQTVSTDEAIASAEAEYSESGKLYKADEVFNNLRRKHLGSI